MSASRDASGIFFVGIREVINDKSRNTVCQVCVIAANQDLRDIRRPEAEGGGFEERYWCPVNSPVIGPGGEVIYIIHRVEDVTEFLRLKQRGVEQEKQAQAMRVRGEQMEAEIFLRVQELQGGQPAATTGQRGVGRLKEGLEQRVQERTAELAERVGLLALSAQVGSALAEGETVRDMLQRCTEALVKDYRIRPPVLRI